MNHQVKIGLSLAAVAAVVIAALWLTQRDAEAQGLRIIIGEDGKPKIVQDEQPANGNNNAPPQVKPLTTQDISLKQALVALNAAHSKAEQIGTKMDIAIVDAGGNLKMFMRMDGAWLGSIDIAIRKAKTARYFDMPTGSIGQLSQPGRSLYNIEHSNGGLITFPGGVPLKAADGTIIGAIGVSGSTVENDHAVATAGASALN
jgi:uncharacterized protein GlcG (DUF336 family)